MIALSLLLACDQAEDLRYRETLEVLGFSGSGDLIDAQFTWGNHDLLSGQSQATFHWIYRRGEPLHYEVKALPSESYRGEDGIRVGEDGLTQSEDGRWTMTLRSEEFSSRIQIDPLAVGEPSPPWERAGRSWEVSIPVFAGKAAGFWRSGSRESLIDGRVVVLRRRGDDPPELRGVEQLGIYVLGEDASIGVDQTGSQLRAWAIAGGLMLPAEDVVVTRTPKGYRVDLRPAVDLLVQIKHQKQRLRSSPWDDLTAPERALAGAWTGIPSRVTRAAQARIQTAGATANYPAITVSTTYR